MTEPVCMRCVPDTVGTNRRLCNDCIVKITGRVDPSTTGARMHALRLFQDMTRQEFGEAVGLSAQQVAALEEEGLS